MLKFLYQLTANAAPALTDVIPISGPSSGGLYKVTLANIQGLVAPITTKGDILTHDGSAVVRLGAGTDTYVLSSLASEATGLKWIPMLTSPLTTKGDIFVYGTTNTRLPIGTDTYVLTADSTQATGMKWAAAAGSGITINSTAITSGTAGRILFENASNQVSEAAGLTYASGLFTVLGTTQQAKFAYDASNHLGITIASNGSATYALTGTSPEHKFNQKINAYGTLLVSNSAGTGYGITLNHYTIQGGGAGLTLIGGSGTINLSSGAEITSHNIATGHRVFVNQYLQSATATAMKWQTSSSPALWGTSIDRMLLRADGNFTIGGSTFPSKLYVESTTLQLQLGYDVSNHAGFTVGATGSLTIALTGTNPRTTFSQGVTFGGTYRGAGFTVATLPSGVVGDSAHVTDATLPTYLGALTGGGAVTCPVFYNGSAWVSA